MAADIPQFLMDETVRSPRPLELFTNDLARRLLEGPVMGFDVFAER
jgi:hypothetical protein